MWPWYGYWHSWGWHRRWWVPPYAWAWAPIPKEEEIAMLEEQARILDDELESVKETGGGNMPNGFGRGRGAGFGLRGGMGFGFRGSSPPRPYVGIGRGGLPRCGYFLSGAGAPAPWPYPPTFYQGTAAAPGYASYSPQMTREEELDFLKDQAEAIKSQLGEIESKMRDLENQQ